MALLPVAFQSCHANLELPAYRTVTERALNDLAESIRAKPRWWMKIYDDVIVAKWKEEAAVLDIPESQFAIVLAELRWLGSLMRCYAIGRNDVPTVVIAEDGTPLPFSPSAIASENASTNAALVATATVDPNEYEATLLRPFTAPAGPELDYGDLPHCTDPECQSADPAHWAVASHFIGHPNHYIFYNQNRLLRPSPLPPGAPPELGSMIDRVAHQYNIPSLPLTLYADVCNSYTAAVAAGAEPAVAVAAAEADARAALNAAIAACQAAPLPPFGDMVGAAVAAAAAAAPRVRYADSVAAAGVGGAAAVEGKVGVYSLPTATATAAAGGGAAADVVVPQVAWDGTPPGYATIATSSVRGVWVSDSLLTCGQAKDPQAAGAAAGGDGGAPPAAASDFLQWTVSTMDSALGWLRASGAADVHPNTDGKVSNLVHPALYAAHVGATRVDCVGDCEAVGAGVAGAGGIGGEGGTVQSAAAAASADMRAVPATPNVPAVAAYDVAVDGPAVVDGVADVSTPAAVAVRALVGAAAARRAAAGDAVGGAVAYAAVRTLVCAPGKVNAAGSATADATGGPADTTGAANGTDADGASVVASTVVPTTSTTAPVGTFAHTAACAHAVALGAVYPATTPWLPAPTTAPNRRSNAPSTNEAAEHRWLPSEVDVAPDGRVRFASYVNGLWEVGERKGAFGGVTAALARLLELSVPLLEAALSETAKYDDHPPTDTAWNMSRGGRCSFVSDSGMVYRDEDEDGDGSGSDGSSLAAANAARFGFHARTTYVPRVRSIRNALLRRMKVGPHGNPWDSQQKQRHAVAALTADAYGGFVTDLILTSGIASNDAIGRDIPVGLRPGPPVDADVSAITLGTVPEPVQSFMRKPHRAPNDGLSVDDALATALWGRAVEHRDGFVAPLAPLQARVSLRGRRLQVISKVSEVRLQPGEMYSGTNWHVEGVPAERIVATIVCYLDCVNVRVPMLSFRGDFSCELSVEQDDELGVEKIWGMELEGDREAFLTEPLGRVATPSGRIVCFPNLHQHKLDAVVLKDPNMPGRRLFAVFFVVDPTTRTLSTAHVPPQDPRHIIDTVKELVPSIGAAAGGAAADLAVKLPASAESLEAARARRAALMGLRTVPRHEDVFDDPDKPFTHLYSLCEH